MFIAGADVRDEHPGEVLNVAHVTRAGRFLIRLRKPVNDRQTDAGFDQEIIDRVGKLGCRAVFGQADFQQADGCCREFDPFGSGAGRAAQLEVEG